MTWEGLQDSSFHVRYVNDKRTLLSRSLFARNEREAMKVGNALAVAAALPSLLASAASPISTWRNYANPR